MTRLILIADDSPVIQRKAQRILQDEGFDVQTVSNGVAAVKKLPAMQPVLVLADVSMPGKDGYEVCEFVKTSAGLRHVPVLLVGSDLEPYDQERGTQVRADGIIKKPFAPHELVAVVRRLTSPAHAPAPPAAEQASAAGVPEPFQEAPAAIQAVSSENTGIGREVETVSDRAAAPLPVADEVVANAGSEPNEHPVTEPELTPGQSDDAALEPSPDAVAETAIAAPGMSRETEKSGVIEEPMVAPQLVDVTGAGDSVEADAVFGETVAEPFPGLVAEPDLIAESASEPVPSILPESATAVAEAVPREEATNPPPPPLHASNSSVAAPEPVLIAIEPPTETVTGVAHDPGRTDLAQEWGYLISAPVAVEASTHPDAEWVYKVVHKVVSRMAPPVLAPEQVEELARLLTREVSAEFGGPGE